MLAILFGFGPHGALTPSLYASNLLSSNQRRARAWWQNIIDNGAGILTGLGLPTAQVASITADAHWAVYAYATVRKAYDEFTKSVTQYANDILHGTPSGNVPDAPAPPDFPAVPGSTVKADIETRRELWVQQVKNLPGYNTTLGAALGIEAGVTPFNPNTYQADVYGLISLSAHTVTGKFRKAGGHVESIHLRGRKSGTAEWVMLGTFSATPFSTLVPLSGTGPELWEFQARAVRRDVEFGVLSEIQELMIRP